MYRSFFLKIKDHCSILCSRLLCCFLPAIRSDGHEPCTWKTLIVKVLSISQLINAALSEKAAKTMKKNCRHLLRPCFKDMMENIRHSLCAIKRILCIKRPTRYHNKSTGLYLWMFSLFPYPDFAIICARRWGLAWPIRILEFRRICSQSIYVADIYFQGVVIIRLCAHSR